MSISLRVLPIAERWDCQGCGNCCRGSIIPLNDADLERLRKQRWDEQPEFRRQAFLVRRGWLRPRYELARKADNSCVFLSDTGRCRIHELYGADAKPLVCQVFPLQVVPLENRSLLTLRRSCPAAAADEGRELSAHLPFARRWAEAKGLAVQKALPLRIARGWTRDRRDAETVLAALERMLCDARWPIVHRLVQAVTFCSLLDAARCRTFDRAKFNVLIETLVEYVPDEVSELFRKRRPPGAMARLLFRQTASEYFRLHPRYRQPAGWRAKFPTPLVSAQIMRGRGKFPLCWSDQRRVTFDQLEQPLGPLPEDVARPLTRYFEAAASSHQYAVLGRNGWAITERLRALALGYAVLQWLLRVRDPQQPVTRGAVIEAIAAIERGQGFAPLEGARHRHRIQTLERLGELPHLLAWYAR